MAAGKSERLVNLTILLLNTRRFLSREKIRTTLGAYKEFDHDNFERTFERDKETLRSLGVPITTGEDLVDLEPGYRILRDEFELPAMEFSPSERVALGLAATVWGQAGAQAQSRSALAKLRAAGIEVEPSASQVLSPRVPANEAAFEALWSAVLERRVVRFQYRNGQLRTVEPWRLMLRSNAWYLIGFDKDRQDSRIFKLSRITSGITSIGGLASFEVPADLPTTISDQSERNVPTILAVKHGRAPLLRRRGVPADMAAPAGFDAIEINLDLDRDLAEIASFGADVLILAPKQARDQMITHLQGVVSR